MSRDIKVDVIFGFVGTIELDDSEQQLIESVGISVSPLVYTIEDNAGQFIIGKELSSLNSAGSYKSLTMNYSDQEKEAMEKEILEKLSIMGFTIEAKKFDFFMNTYYW